MVRNPYKLMSVSLISTMLMACGGAESDPKLNQSQTQPKSSNISGIALDGYLHKAKVCLDRNSNAMCDSADGDIATTDTEGRFQLDVDNDVVQYPILVEAVAGITIDMDSPNQPIESGFTLEVPSSNSDVISPVTSLIASVSRTSGISFDAASQLVANDLGIDKQLAIGDYSGSSAAKSREVHMFARGVTRVLQEAQIASVDAGVDQVNARKGSIYKLAELDLVKFKAETDKLSHGASGTDSALKQLGKEYRDQLKVSQEDIDGNKIITSPPAPRYGQVRVAASDVRNTPAGKPLLSDKAFTLTTVPAAPASITVNNAINQFDWAFVDSFNELGLYEYSLDDGLNWIQATEKPQNIRDLDIPRGHLKVRVAKDDSLGHPTGLSAASETPMTVTPVQPTQPVLEFADDSTNQINWLWVNGYNAPSFYEINLGSGWKDVTTLPYLVGNVSLPANTISVRVKSNALDARPAGVPLVIGSAFIRSEHQPVAPTMPIVDDAENSFAWTDVEGFTGSDDYEYSLDRGITFSPATSNPQTVPDEVFAKGKICVRVKAESDPQHEAGETLCSDKPYTETPQQPEAPTAPITDDDNDTFDWTFVPGFSSNNDYEIQINSLGNWKSVTHKPYQLGQEDYAVGSIIVRVKEDFQTGRPVGDELYNDVEFTAVPKAPKAPTGLVVNDVDNTLNWAYFDEFTHPEYFEVTLDSGTTWATVTTKPIPIGNIAKKAGEVQVRVRENPDTGMPHGAEASTSKSFTIEVPKCKDFGGPCIYLWRQNDGKLITFPPSQAYLNTLGGVFKRFDDTKNSSKVSYETPGGLDGKAYFYNFSLSGAHKLCGVYNNKLLGGRSNWRLPSANELIKASNEAAGDVYFDFVFEPNDPTFCVSESKSEHSKYNTYLYDSSDNDVITSKHFYRQNYVACISNP